VLISFPNNISQNLTQYRINDTPCQGVTELLFDGFITLSCPVINPLEVCLRMFYCIFIERRSDENLDITSIAAECSKDIDSFLVRLNTRSYGLGRRL
jgi:hypothetical protein